MPWSLPLSWEALGWLHELGWYRAMLRAEWFQPIRPIWERYHLDWALVGLTALLGLVLLWRLARLLRPRRAGSGNPRKLALETAEHMLARGELSLAAAAFQQAGEIERASQILEAAGAHAQAGELAESRGDLERAARLYEQAKDEAGRLRVLVKAGRVDEAVSSLGAAGRLPDAAGLLLREGRPLEAARLYEQAGLFTRAAEVYRDAGEGLRAAEALLKLMGSSSAGFTQDEVDMLVEGAAALQRAGRFKDSAEMLVAAGEFAGAAQRFETLGDRERAADCHERDGRLARAAALCEDPRRRLELLERMRREGLAVSEQDWTAALAAAGRHDRAAAALKARGDVLGAAEALGRGGDLAGAGVLLAGAGRPLEAARAFEEAGDPAAAQEQFLRAGDRPEAARMALQAGRALEAGALFFELGDMARAVEALQRVPPGDARLPEALSLLARAFAALGDESMARRTHARAVDGLELGPGRLEPFYEQAVFLMDAGRPADQAQALELFVRILEVDYGFRDARERLQTLERKRAPRP
jgi:tetratricopeptide (TPR) repeat protein